MSAVLSRARSAEALLVLSALCFGTLAIFGKLAYQSHLNVQSLLGLRFAIAGVLLLGIALVRRRPMPAPRTLAALALLGAGGYVGQSAAYFNSIRYVPAAVTAILLYTYPAMVTVLSVPLYGARVTAARAAALALALAGCAMVASPSGGLRWEGVLLGLLSAVVYSAYILAGKRLVEDVDAVTATAVVALSAGLTYLSFSLLTRSLVLPGDERGWLAVAGIVVLATMIAAGAFLAGLRRTDPGRASLISTLEPVSTAALAALVLGESLGPLQLVGGALVLLAVVLVSRA
ncbi:MAG: DMT family transporter [Candidatus Dormibacteraeota bacterium]|nr:DMT family transporter [Candidatus Dormibacteraeota bacterium]